MKQAHHIFVSVFSHEKDSEDLDLIEEKFVSLFPFDLEKEKLAVTKNVALGVEEKKIHIFELGLEKDRHINAFIDSLVSTLSVFEKRKVLNQLESRLDDDLYFFLRFDKAAYLDSNKLILTDSGSCFHVKIGIAVFPKKREKAVEVLKGVFEK